VSTVAIARIGRKDVTCPRADTPAGSISRQIHTAPPVQSALGMMSMASLLIHDDRIPRSARDALRAASAAPAGQRDELLASAARILHDSVQLDCADACELVGLAH
jgi:hypothetical protein